MKTYQKELVVVALVLAAVAYFSNGGWIELVGSAAVLAAFAHAQVADRMAEEQSIMERPTVDCWPWLRRYFFAKEVLWLLYFVLHRSWAATAGVFVFLAYPFWRQYWSMRQTSKAQRAEQAYWDSFDKLLPLKPNGENINIDSDANSISKV